MASNEDFIAMIAVDKSQQASYAFAFYLSDIHHAGNKVYLVHVPEGPTTTTEEKKHHHLNAQEWQTLMEKEQKETEELTERYKLKLLDAEVEGDYQTFYGKPGEAICEAAEQLKANIIILGTRGHGTIRRTILGSVSDYILHHAHVPVIICRQ